MTPRVDSGSSPGLAPARIAELLSPYLEAATTPNHIYLALASYLELLLRWNARTNLTAIRSPEEIVTRHFGESLFAARHLSGFLRAGDTLLDFGSGAGFPGIPIQLFLPELLVTLAEAQGKKSAFLQEAVRTLGLPCEIWPKRVEAMPPERRFRAITLRAVDNMPLAIAEARKRVLPGGFLAVLATSDKSRGVPPADTGTICVQLPGLASGSLIVEQLA